MAVQAQYPSNLLFLNRNGQEGHDYSLQSQPGGFLDQSHMLFNSGETNPRKRGRQTSATNAIVAPINHFSVQHSNPPHLIDISQLQNQNQQPNVVSTGLRLAFNDQQLHQSHQLHQQKHITSHQSQAFSSPLTDDFASHIQQQRDELDRFLHAHADQLRRTLAEKRQAHYRALLGAAEESVARRLREKEAEFEKATRRNAELEARAAQLTVEAQVWQAKARAQEATAVSLQTQLQQAIMSGTVIGAPDKRAVASDGRDFNLGVEGGVEDAESAYIDPDRVISSRPSCKSCRNRAASVVLLPCRHLSVCAECDRVVQACPVCLTLRNSSVEVYLS